MQVVWELNAVTLIAMVIQLVAGVAWVTRLHGRATSAEERSRKVEEDLSDLKQAFNERVRMTQEQLSDLRSMLASFRESVALSYIQREQLAQLETSIQREISSIRQRLEGDVSHMLARIDRLVERYLPSGQP